MSCMNEHMIVDCGRYLCTNTTWLDSSQRRQDGIQVNISARD